MGKVSISIFFEADHDRLDKLFENFQKSKVENYAKAKEYFAAFKQGLQRHIVWEEDILFPLFEKGTGLTGSGPTYVMRMEHRQIAELLESVHEKVKHGDPDSTEQEERLLRDLSVHNQKEENILYPAIDRALTAAEREAIFETMKNIPEERYSVCCQNT